MRCAILSDIHSNLSAFRAVLQDVDRRGGAERIWCLGDVVGYGPDPRECVDLLRQHDHICVTGNHDWGALAKIDLNEFNTEAAAACRWTGRQLGADEADYLANLALTHHEGDFTMVHGSPRDPIWEYLISPRSALISFDYFETGFCLVGHSHIPLVFEQSPGGTDCLLHELVPNDTLGLGENRLIINPGSVGQPRDGDPRASYAIYDGDRHALFHYRVPYDIDVTRQKMAALGLPEALISRLALGR